MPDDLQFTSRALDHWAYWNQVELDFSQPGKPVESLASFRRGGHFVPDRSRLENSLT